MTTEIINIVPGLLKWWHFHQNNSGGEFLVNDKIAHDVFIQATDAQSALYFAQRIPLDPYESYCPCCGERWWLDVEYKDGTSEPMDYDRATNSTLPYAQCDRGYFGDEARYHYIDGHIESVKKGSGPAPERIAA